MRASISSIKNLYLPFVVSLTLFLTLLTTNQFGYTAKGGTALLFAYALLILSFVDLRTQILPDIITKPLILAGLVQGYFGIHTSWMESLSGAVVGYGLLWCLNTAFRHLRKKEGMGYGDFKLLAAIGAWCGIGQLSLVILVSSLVGIAATLLAAVIFRHSVSKATPFGPSLALAGMISLYYGQGIMTWYLSFFY